MVTAQRDQYLQQLGIRQWQLRNPMALRGELSSQLPDEVRLLVVTPSVLVLDQPLIIDVLRTLNIDRQQVLALTGERVAMLSAHRPCNSWWLGVEAQALAGAQLVSPEFSVLQRSAAARAALWQQICEYEQDFFA